jgi:hypothetical protein
MSEAEDKLRFLARQARQLSRAASDRNRSKMLRSLADLYERQAAELHVLASAAGKPHSPLEPERPEFLNL